MKKLYISALALLSLVFSCKSTDKDFLIAKDSIGGIKKETKAFELKNIFNKVTDSVSYNHSYSNNIGVFQNNKLALEISTFNRLDSTSTIKSITIKSEKFKTEKGVNLNSTFKDLKDNHTVSKTTTLMSIVNLSVNEIDAEITIDKKELPSESRFVTADVDQTQIPETAKFKYFIIYWF